MKKLLGRFLFHLPMSIMFILLIIDAINGGTGSLFLLIVILGLASMVTGSYLIGKE